jgi:hypothetical protein
MFYMKLRVKKLIGAVVWFSGLIFFVFPAENRAILEADTQLSDKEFFDALNLDYPGLDVVRAAVRRENFDLAKSTLCDYYRQRSGRFWWPDSSAESADLRGGRNIVDRTGLFTSKNWISADEFNWEKTDQRTRRMYLFSSLADAYQSTGSEEIVRVWINLFRAWIRQMPSDGNRLQTGIRLKGGWGDAFCSFVDSPTLDDDSLFLYLKSYYEQALYLRKTHSDSSNWLTFEMCGLYSTAVLFPELKEAEEWRDYVLDIALADLNRGWMPDGVTIELSPGYGQFFRNYLAISDLARDVGISNPKLEALVEKTERLYVPYLQMMTPDGKTPEFNDNHAVDVPELMKAAVERFPRDDFQWAATRGREGTCPDYLSVAFPYAGWLTIRSGWEWNANYLCFDAGPAGYRHAHQDKLSMVMWAYGRRILIDNGPNYDGSAFESYFRDTFSHSTGLVDNRPQRSMWYRDPSPEKTMPYQPRNDFRYEIQPDCVWASGVYSNQYGRPGSVGAESYPYKKGGNFKSGMGSPASHYRQVAYVAPDIFVVQDLFVPNDEAGHDYEIRWQLDSLDVQADGLRARTAESSKPNLAIVPLQAGGLNVETVSAQKTPEFMGWAMAGKKVEPITTLRHMTAGKGSQGFLTLLFPLQPGQPVEDVSVETQKNSVILIVGGSRRFKIIPAKYSEAVLKIKEF